MGIVGLFFCFVVKSCYILMCLGIRYLVSNSVKVFNILEIKVLSFPSLIVLTLACVFLSIVSDIRAGMVLDSKAGSELGNAMDALDL